MTENLTTDAFIEKVFDFKTEKEWKFKGDKPCIIDFYADWCQPCKTIAPILDELSDEHEHINVYKIDVEKEQDLASAFGISSIPSILIVPVGETPQMAQGALPKEEFQKIITELLK